MKHASNGFHLWDIHEFSASHVTELQVFSPLKKNKKFPMMWWGIGAIAAPEIIHTKTPLPEFEKKGKKRNRP